MTLYFSKTKNGFYDSLIFTEIPSDAVEITEDKRQELLIAQSNGQIIQTDKKGNPKAMDRPAPSNEELIALYNKEAQLNLDSIAQSWGYDSLLVAASYANSTNDQFKTEAKLLIEWRDSYWTEAYTLEAGTLPATAEAFVAMLPDAPSKPVI